MVLKKGQRTESKRYIDRSTHNSDEMLRSTKHMGRLQKKNGKKDDIVQKGGRGLGKINHF